MKSLEEALRHLKKDEQFKVVIKNYPAPVFKKTRNVYGALIRSIVYQQLSGKAAGTILKRFLDLFEGPSYPKPEELLKVNTATLREVGLSGQKVSYIQDLSTKFLDGTIQPKKFKGMSDEEIREHLIAIKGIGRWSADMFLMSSLHRPDVLPTGDLGIQKGFKKLFALKTLPSVTQMERLAKPWQPYRTVASMYLWRIADEDK